MAFGEFCLRDTAGSPERARSLHLARSGSQSQRAISFIVPARWTRHIIIHVIFQYRTNDISLHVVYKWKQRNSFLVSSLNSREQTLIFYSSCTLRFYSKEASCGSSTDKTNSHADRHFKISRSMGDRYHADVWGNRQTKTILVE